MLGDPRGEAAQVLASHDAARVSTYLLQLLSSEAGGGMDISIQTSEVLQGVFHSKWNLQVKRLAYDLCKAVPISDEDISMHVLPGIKSDLAVDSSGSPEMAAQALRFVPHLQPHILAELVEAGEVAQMFEPAQCALQPEVRGAATAALGQVLLVPAVLHSAAKAAGDPPLGSSVLSTLLPPNLVLPPLPVLVPSVLSHLSAMATNRAGDAAVRTEACRAMLKICVMVGSGDMGFSNPSPQGLTDADAHRVPLPLGWARKALEGLLDLEEGGMHLVEPGSHEIVGAAVEGLSVLPLGARQHFLARLWPILTRIRDAPTRLRLFATAWAAAVQHLHSPGLVDASVERMFKDAFLLKAISGEEGGTYQSAAQLALQAHLKEQHQQEHQRQRRALEHKDELQQQQQQQQKLQALQIPQVEASNEQGVNREGDQEPGAQQQQPSPGAKQQPSPTQQAPPPQQRVRAQPPPPPGAGAGRLTASVPTRSKAPPRPPQAANAQAAANRLTSNAPPSRAPAPPQAAAKQPPNRQAAQGAGGQLAAASAAELDRSSSGSKGGSSSRSRSMASGMLSMFKRDKKADTLGLDAVHSTQQFDAPSQNAQPPAQKLQQSRASMDRASAHTSSAAADGGKSSSIVTKPVQTTASTLNTIVTMGGMLGGSKEDFGSDARQEAAESGEVPPAGVLRHEVTCTLLGVVATQPAARAARELCQEAAVAAAHDKKAVAAGLGGHGVLAQQPGMALNLEAWLLLVGHTLQATKPCLHWEPLLAPAITPNLSPASASHLPADFSTAAPDMWLQLLLLAAGAVPVLQAALLEQQEQMANAKLMRVAAGEASDEEDPFGLGIGKHGKDDNDDDDNVSISSVSSSDSENSSSFASAASSSSGVSLPDQVIPNRGPRALRVGGIDGQRVQAKKEAKAKRQAQEGVEEDDWGEGAQKKKLSKLEKRKAKVMAKREAMRPRTQMEKLMLSLERCYAQLDQLLKQLLVDWTCLTRSLRPRVLWVVGWPRDKPFTFDIAAASALCEGPDYDASALVVGFTAAQHLTLKLQVSSARAFRHTNLWPASSQRAWAVPGLREWAKRVLRGLATIALYVPPAQREREEADKKQEAARRKRKEKRREQRRKEGGGNEGSSTSSSGSDVDGDSTVPPEDAQQQQGGGDDSSSDGGGGGGRAPAQGGDDDGNGFARSSSNKSSDSSSIDGTGGTMPVAMPPSLFMLQNMAKGKPPPPPPGAPQVAVDSEGLPTHGQVGVTNSFAEPQANDFAQGTKEYTDPGKNVASQGGVAPDDEEVKKAAKARFKEAFKSRAATIGQGNGSIAQYMLQSGAPYAPWGYPFSWGPRAAALAPSRRTRRSRNLASHVAAALTYILKGAPLLPGIRALLLPGAFWKWDGRILRGKRRVCACTDGDGDEEEGDEENGDVASGGMAAM
ncbi:hypothetical protein DUNSADRAFT_14356 [Dunaliella salina]|uniref:Uncharacterized protein n=1 Tax=Dunaliella salina TaxID=3046 RepID=A0ABQ7G7G9_DUNSA|nr:hypothetical protein DUNSADRAFT_14356 [Dunaliella salina]|eukprot:KAF5830549.1 hypothetical protein DUNSADRAFT_14356 [Dunaliella salina]